MCPLRLYSSGNSSDFARNGERGAACKSMLRRKGVKVASIGERLAGRLKEAVIEGVDEFHSENRGHRRGPRQPRSCRRRPWELHLLEGGIQ